MERHPVADQIEKRMQELGIKPKRLALDAGVGPTYVRDLLSGHSREPKAGKLRQIAFALGCTLEDLMPTSESSGRESVRPVAVSKVMVRGDVQAGVWREAVEWPRSDWYAITAPADTAYPGMPRYGLLVRGESMNKIFPDGSVVVVINFCDLGRNPATGDLVVAIQRSTTTGEFEATVKAVQILDNGDAILWPQSTDPDFAVPIRVPRRDGAHDAGMPEIAIQALVVASYRPNPRVTF